ncbi:hypothetical protein CH63R_10084 [Colletotrichum higginsianum IMI 349063]|uniref:Uncharacterized protein n=1 Tax=Colletotrichum higginsianum (strain IMI 349063) TaxID=759273 RepID=A0A1B7Y1R7_COLHI|nr:uncharacterized protein CH63R_10084 [Colletotrichum higginsianum IMI 349063]OBR05964.1 hypothetical protein CH63R_10084 [Colletotrichum higginsianum IMI 349063]
MLNTRAAGCSSPPRCPAKPSAPAGRGDSIPLLEAVGFLRGAGDETHAGQDADGAVDTPEADDSIHCASTGQRGVSPEPSRRAHTQSVVFELVCASSYGCGWAPLFRNVGTPRVVELAPDGGRLHLIRRPGGGRTQ